MPAHISFTLGLFASTEGDPCVKAFWESMMQAALF